MMTKRAYSPFPYTFSIWFILGNAGFYSASPNISIYEAVASELMILARGWVEHRVKPVTYT